jgi:hypothetical protein
MDSERDEQANHQPIPILAAFQERLVELCKLASHLPQETNRQRELIVKRRAGDRTG